MDSRIHADGVALEAGIGAQAPLPNAALFEFYALRPALASKLMGKELEAEQYPGASAVQSAVCEGE